MTDHLPSEPKWKYIAGSLGLILAVGVVDYLTGAAISFSVFYLMGVAVGTWFVGNAFGAVGSCLSVVLWLAGDFAAGADFSAPFVPVWNGLILLSFYLIVVWLLGRLRNFNRLLEDKVLKRTADVRLEMAERERLENQIIEISEQERRRIGHDLHDIICQHLTGTALAGQVLKEKLDPLSPALAGDAARLVHLTEEGVTMARNLARGLYPVEMGEDGLMSALSDLASNTTKWFRTPCEFVCESPVLINDSKAATHLCRIAQEAVSNALRHGKPSRILVSLSERDRQIHLLVEDDGCGLPEEPLKTKGIGLRIMAHRTAIIGATLKIEPNPLGGTLVKCVLPLGEKEKAAP